MNGFLTPSNSASAKGNRLKWLRQLTQLSQSAFAVKHGFNFSTLKGWEAARHGGLTLKGAQRLLNALQQENVSCSLQWLMEGKGLLPKLVVPTAKLNSEKEQIQAELQYFRDHNGDTDDIIIEDDAMLPCYHPGDIVAGIKRYKKSIKSLLGQNCIVETDKGERWVRHLHAQTKEHYTLTTLNQSTRIKRPTIYEVTLISAAPIIWLRSLEPK